MRIVRRGSRRQQVRWGCRRFGAGPLELPGEALRRAAIARAIAIVVALASLGGIAYLACRGGAR